MPSRPLRPFAAASGVVVIRPVTPAAVRAAALPLVTFAALGAGLAACSDQNAEGGTLVASERDSVRRDPPVIVTPATPYRAAPVANGGRIRGTVRVAGSMPEDTTVRPTMDTRVCGTSFVDRTILGNNRGIGPVIIWLADARAGKPLPLGRRFEVRNARCQIEPRVQAVIAGGTLNVRSADPLVHRTRVLRQGSGEIVARYEHNDFGQVVPDDDVLARPGLLELRSEVHPWTRGFIAVFDHPYFAVTGANGAFTLTDVPPGDYTIAAWHERLGRIEQRVTVRAGAAAPVTLTFGADSAAAMLPTASTPGAALAGEPEAPGAARAESPR